MRIAFVVLLLAGPAWASPPVAPPVKAAPRIVEAKKPEPKKAEPLKLERHVDGSAKKADAATSTLSLNAPKKKPAHRVNLPDWQP